MNELIREYRINEEGKELYKKRKEKVERSFADSKQITDIDMLCIKG